MNFLSNFIGTWLTTVFLNELLLNTHQFVDGLDHVDRDTNGACLVSNRTGDGLADPPGSVGGKLVTAAVFKFFYSLHEAHVAFLNKVEEGEATVGVFLGDRDDEAQVGFNHFCLCLVGFTCAGA